MDQINFALNEINLDTEQVYGCFADETAFKRISKLKKRTFFSWSWQKMTLAWAGN